MQDVSERWIATNAAPFTVRSYVTIWIQRNSGIGSLGIPPEKIISYSQGFTGDMLAGEIPEVHAIVKVDNSDGYYSRIFAGEEKDDFEHAKADIWIAFEFTDENNQPDPESINGGRLYISEVSFDAKDRTATIRFADILQFMNTQYNGTREGLAQNIIEEVINQALAEDVVPVSGINTEISPLVLQVWNIRIPKETTLAETLQLCANARNCVLFVDRDSTIHIEPIDRAAKNYLISRDVQYINPSLSKDKSINSVLVKFPDDNELGLVEYEYRRQGQIGAQQIVANPAIQSIFNGMSVARRTYRTLQENRTVITGEFRCDPRVDIFDCIQIEASKKDLTIADLETFELSELEEMTINELEESKVDLGVFCLYSLEMEFTGAWHGRFAARAVDEYSNTDLQTWGDLKRLTWGQARDYSWDEARGGQYA